MLFCKVLKKPFRAGAGPSLEQALEMKRAQVDMRGDFVQGRATKLVGVEEAQCALDSGVVHRRLRERLRFALFCGWRQYGFHDCRHNNAGGQMPATRFLRGLRQ